MEKLRLPNKHFIKHMNPPNFKIGYIKAAKEYVYLLPPKKMRGGRTYRLIIRDVSEKRIQRYEQTGILQDLGILQWMPSEYIKRKEG